MTTETKRKKIEINDENPSVIVCVYGTLRAGHNNHNYILKDNSEYLGTFKTEPRFTMTGRGGGFPIVYDNGNTSIEYEAYRITNPEIVRRCHSLEGFRGEIGHPSNWYDMCEIQNEQLGTCYMYVQHGDFNESSVIKSGNWNEKL